jgi:elongation factor P--beta-lysine ligase
MSTILNVNWDTVDYDKKVADYINMPDGTQRVIEMTMLHWYIVSFMTEHGYTPLSDLINDIVEELNADPEADFEEEFDDLLRLAIMTWGRTWIENVDKPRR